MKIQEGDAHNIFCPAYECYQLVPVHVIQSVVSREMDERYLHFDIKVKKKIILHNQLFRSLAFTPAFMPFVSFLTSWLFTLVCIFCFIMLLVVYFAFPVLASRPVAGICREQSFHPMVPCGAL